MLKFAVITIFPGMFDSSLGHSILEKAQGKGLIKIDLLDLRGYTNDRHRSTDDTPYGGGQGMVMKPEPLVAAVEHRKSVNPRARVILLTPHGQPFNQQAAQRLSLEEEIVLICGRYEGIDERVKAFVDEELSIGDFTLSGGEPAANVVIDAVARLVPGVLGNQDSPLDESFINGLLEYPQYTRPENFRGMKVPDVLLSGDHERIRRWRHQQSLELTRKRRPDLYAKLAHRSDEETGRPWADMAPVYIALLHHPVYDKNGQVVTTAVTNMDIHDIARSACTYGLKGFFVVTPVIALQRLAQKIIDHWETGYGSQYNVTRKDALSLVRICATLDDTIISIEQTTREKPLLVATSARRGPNRTSFAHLQDMLNRETRPFLILLGTGWGLTETVLSQSDYVLEAIEGRGDYNHLSVRSAAAIIMDRLTARRELEE